MEWYYAEEGREVGPVTGGDVERLVKAGRITSTTLVWNPQMAGWEEYGKVRARAAAISPKVTGVARSEGQSVCCECGKILSQEDMIRYGDSWVCGACKPVFIQKLKEGVPLCGTMEYAGFWIRVVAKLIDGMILGVVNMVFYVPLGLTMASQSDPYRVFTVTMILNALFMGLQVAYTTFFLGRFGATPGKMAGRLKVVTSDGGKVSYLRALGRHFAELITSMTLLIGYIIAAFDDQKRTLHDRICNTRVVRR
jgi:uncharacterized RDD family membrane protein YckC